MLILIIMGLSALPLFILGLCMRKGKGLMLLAGYNTMPKAERDKIDKKALSIMAGNLLLRMSLELALMGLAIYLGFTWAFAAFLIILIADPCILAVRLSRKTKNVSTSKTSRIIIVGITAICIIAVALMFITGEDEPSVIISHDAIQIEAMYGVNLDVSEIRAITLIDSSMKDIGIGSRTNGYGGIGTTLRGHFHSDSLGDYLLFVKSDSSPTIFIECKSRENIYLSFSNAETTLSIFNELKEAVPTA